MLTTLFMAITAFTAVSREIREWIALRKREKDDESHPPFLTYSSLVGQHLYLTRQYTNQS